MARSCQPAVQSVPSSSAPLSTIASAMVTAKPPAVTARKISPIGSSATSGGPSSSRGAAGPAFHPGSASNSSSTSSSVPFKTSTERRERNKASQRESRKRKQDRLETLETENAALRKALADTKKFSHALSNGAGIRGQDGAEVAPLQFTKFTGAFHLDLIESHLEDDSAEAEWKDMIGHRFPAPTSQAEDGDGAFPAAGSTSSDSDEDNTGDGDSAAKAQGGGSVKSEVDGASTATTDKPAADSSSQTASQQVKKAMWEISLNQKRQKAAQNFPRWSLCPS